MFTHERDGRTTSLDNDNSFGNWEWTSAPGYPVKALTPAGRRRCPWRSARCGGGTEKAGPRRSRAACARAPRRRGTAAARKGGRGERRKGERRQAGFQTRRSKVLNLVSAGVQLRRPLPPRGPPPPLTPPRAQVAAPLTVATSHTSSGRASISESHATRRLNPRSWHAAT